MIHVSHAVSISSNQDRRQGRRPPDWNRPNHHRRRRTTGRQRNRSGTGGRRPLFRISPETGYTGDPQQPPTISYTRVNTTILLPFPPCTPTFPLQPIVCIPSLGIPQPLLSNPYIVLLGIFRLGILPYGMAYPFNYVLRAI